MCGICVVYVWYKCGTHYEHNSLVTTPSSTVGSGPFIHEGYCVLQLNLAGLFLAKTLFPGKYNVMTTNERPVFMSRDLTESDPLLLRQETIHLISYL